MEYASLVLMNATVWAGRGCDRRPGAVAVRGERIAAVGSDANVAALIGPGTRVIDAGGRLALPGFNDSHAHVLLGGRQLAGVDLAGARSREDFARLIAARAAELPQGRWLTGGSWDHERWPSRVLPAKDDIDAFTPATPVFVSRLDLHMGLANSHALRLAGITAATADPPGGAILRDAAGEPTGILKDTAMDLVWRVMPKATLEESAAAVAKACDYAASLGVTTLQDMAVWDEWDNWRVFEAYRAHGPMAARLCVRMPLATWLEKGAPSGGGDAWLRLGGVKAFVDGSLGSSTALFFAPYDDDPGNSGLLMQPPEALRDQLAAADRAGLQTAVHAIGDKANSLLLDVFAAVAAANGRRDRRLRVEHAQHLAAGDIGRMADQGLIASVQPYHLVDDGRWAEKRIGPDRAKLTYAFRSLLDAGVVLAFGSDWPVAPLSPLPAIHAAVTRDTGDARQAGGWHPEQRLGVAEAVHAYTAAAAYAEFAEADKGTLTPGKLADFVVLSRDIFTVAPEEIASAEVVLTVCGGRVVWEK